MFSIPHSKNFCGGSFQDWLEVMLESRCNGRCSFCIEKDGFRPNNKISWQELSQTINATNKTKI